jgi:hypothetical protein
MITPVSSPSYLLSAAGASIYGVFTIAEQGPLQKLPRITGKIIVVRPLLGSSLAIITYVLLRAGLISTSFTQGSPNINDFGVAGISALVGLMTDEIVIRIRGIFSSIFGNQREVDEQKRKNN